MAVANLCSLLLGLDLCDESLTLCVLRMLNGPK